jgi:glycine oxidase
MQSKAEVLIVGGGVIGLTTAYYLAREGLVVEVIDQGDFGQEASWAGAGILPPGNPAGAQSPFDQLRAQSAVMFPQFSAELKVETQIDNGYLRSGGLAFGASGAVSTVDLWQEEGIEFEPVRERELQSLEPALAPGLQTAYFLPGMAQLRNPRHIKALLAWCQKKGVRLRSGCAVMGLEHGHNRITALKTSAGELVADRYLLAAGAWTDTLLLQVGWRPGIHPVRGQIALVNAQVPFLSRIILEGKRYLVPRADGRVLIGATEEEVGFDKRTTVGAMQELLAFGVGMVPGLAGATLEKCWAGLRPGSPDGLPFLGMVPNFENLYVAAGHFRSGIQLSPATGLVMKELMLGQKLTVPLDLFRLDRPAGNTFRAAFRS